MKFIRRNWTKFSKLGKKRKKKQVWRRAKGRDNKIREKRKGYPIKVMVGFKQPPKAKPSFVRNMKELENIKKGEKIIVGRTGMKKRIEIIKKAKEKGVQIQNLNANKMLKKTKKKEEKVSAEKKDNKSTEEKK